MDGASIGAGIAIGFATGFTTGMETGKRQYTKKLQKLLDTGQITIQTASGDAIRLAELDNMLKRAK